MAFELGEVFNRGADWICGLSGVFAIINNPIFIALLITGLALVIIYAVFRENLKGAGWRRGLKAGFWLTIGVSVLVFVHYYALERCLRNAHASQGIRSVVDSINYSASIGGGHSVYPATDSGGLAPATGGDADPTGIDDLGLEEFVLRSKVV